MIPALDRLVAVIAEQSGRLGVSFVNGMWTVALEWGVEAPDSPMVGAASYAVADTLDEALFEVLSEVGV